MKSKYTIIRDKENKQLIIKEYAEVDKDALTFVGEEAYADKMIRSAISKGSEKLISALRTINFYPSGMFARGLAEAIIDFYPIITIIGGPENSIIGACKNVIVGINTYITNIRISW